MNSTTIYASIQLIATAFIPILLGMICHEVAHGWSAYKMGDPTAKLLGRLTLNPVPHLDPMGSLFFIMTAVLSATTGTPFIFGWAKPVPVNPNYFKNPRKGMVISSFAGPLTNFLLAFIFVFLYASVRFMVLNGVLPLNGLSKFLLSMTEVGVWINVSLGCFNLLPLPPLDGSHILAGILPRSIAEKYYNSMQRYGMIIVLVLLVSGILGKILSPLVSGIVKAMLSLIL